MARFRAMTWNVENLLKVGADGGPETAAQLDAKIASLAAVIDAAKPDVLGLQEVGPDSLLKALQGALTHAMPHRAISSIPDGRGIRVAALSRFPISKTRQIRRLAPGLSPVQTADVRDGDIAASLMTELDRGALQVDVSADEGTVSVVIAHLKSKLLSFVDEFGNSTFAPRDENQRARYGAYALNRRAAEAASLRSHLNGVLAGEGRERFVLLMGDLNDEVNAATTQILNGPGGSEIGTAGFQHADKGDGDRMWNLAPLIPEDQRFSRIYRGRPELIDHIFASHRMLKRTPTVSTAIAKSQAETLRSIEDDPRPEQGKPGSDHSAVIAEFGLA